MNPNEAATSQMLQFIEEKYLDVTQKLLEERTKWNADHLSGQAYAYKVMAKSLGKQLTLVVKKTHEGVKA